MKQIKGLIMRCIFLGLFLVNTPIGWAVSDVSVSPENPRPGDIISVQVTGSPFEELDISISFSEELTVTDNSFSWLNTVKVPIYPNVLSLTADGVDFIRVSVDLDFLSITKTSMGEDGVATVNHFDVFPGTYIVEISGKSLQDREKISIVFKVSSSIMLDNVGEYEETFDSSYFPLGRFNVIVGLLETSVIITDSPPNMDPTAYFEFPSKSWLGEIVQLNASESRDEDGEITDFVWNIDNSTYHGETIVWTPENVGDYVVSLTVIDDEGAERVILNTITIEANNTWIKLGCLVLVFGVVIWIALTRS